MMQSPIARGLVLGACFVIVVAGLRAAATFLAPALFALLIAVAVLPIINWLKQRGLPNWASVLVVTLGGVILGIALISYVSASLGRLGQNLPMYETRLSVQYAAITDWISGFGVKVPRAFPPGLVSVSRVFGILGSFVHVLTSSLTSAFLILLLFVVFASELPKVSAHFGAKLGAESHAVARFIALGGNISSYFQVRAINNLFVSGALTALLWILGVDFAGLWGVLSFFLGFIPTIGLPLAVAPAVLLGWIEHGWVTGLIVIAGALICNFLGDYVITPHLAGKTLNMSTVTIFLSFIFWAWVFGASGAFMSVPLTSIVMMALDSFDETRWVADLMSAKGVTESPEQGVTVEETPTGEKKAE